MKWNRWVETKPRKPVLLYLSAFYCHWCHTLDREVFADKQVREFIEKFFVPVRVDIDERPDVYKRYGVGLPTLVILNKDLMPVHASQFVAKQHMLAFLKAGLKKSNRKPKIPSAKKEHALVSSEDIYALICDAFDPHYGGFGVEPKVPHLDNLEYLLWRVAIKNDAKAKHMLEKTCDAMLNIFDQGYGGFYDSAALRNWTILRFEKLLLPNARLIGIYHHAFHLLKRKEYLSVVNKTLAYVFTCFYNQKERLFYAGEDADEHFCHLPFGVRRTRVPPAIDKRFLTDANAAMVIALFELSLFEPEYRNIALAVLSSLKEKKLEHVIGKKGVFLRDIVYLLAAALQAYELTKKQEWKAYAKKLMNMLKKFRNAAFNDTLNASPGLLRMPHYPVHENAFAAIALKKYEQLFDEKTKWELVLDKIAPDAKNPYDGLYALAKEL